MGRDRRGFVLIELLVVVGLIAIIAAVSFPYLVPVIAFSELEGAARHLTGYGESAMSHSAMMRERITVRFDLDKNEYWCIRWPEPEEEDGKYSLDGEKGVEGQREGGMFDMAALAEGGMDELDEKQVADQAQQLDASFEKFAQMALMTRARNVGRESASSEFDPLFEKEFTLEIDDEEEGEELITPLLGRVRLPDEVEFDSIIAEGQEYKKGEADVNLSPLGLTGFVVIYVKNADDDYYTIEWDPITGGTYLYEGKEELL
jgi:prepilin-type N-terminal cleavage/methylation domain-containing protein